MMRLVAERFERAPNGDYHDSNWITGAVELDLVGYSARQAVAWQAEDLHAFARALTTLENELSGVAELVTLEDQVNLKITLDHGSGLLEGGVREHARAALLFEGLRTDQSHIRMAAAQMRAIADAFPVRDV